MDVKQIKVTIGEVCENYHNDDEEGVFGYNNRLNIRPKYQREFVYEDKLRDSVIRTISKNLPLNVFYWSKVKNEDGSDGFEIIDGQQRTISFCEYVDGNYPIDNIYFQNLSIDQQKAFLEYPLFVYVCSGPESERLEWFKTINVAGKTLTEQEIRNAVYAGPWTADAKRYFSKRTCPAKNLADLYMKGNPIRQDYLETALKWISNAENMEIDNYMAIHQNHTAIKIWTYFGSVIEWVKSTFPTYYPEMCGLQWGLMYNKNKDRDDLDPKVLDKRVAELMEDEDVTTKSGIFSYLLDGDERKLSIRKFDKRDKLTAYGKQNHKCAICGKEFSFNQMEGDHIVPWSKGGKTVPENCQMLCKKCNIMKSNS